MIKAATSATRAMSEITTESQQLSTACSTRNV